jgi:hypothetical protein
MESERTSKQGRAAVALAVCAVFTLNALGSAHANPGDSSVIVVAPAAGAPPPATPAPLPQPPAPIAPAAVAQPPAPIAPAPTPVPQAPVALPIQPAPLEGTSDSARPSDEPRTDAQRLHQRGVRQRNVGILLLVIAAGLGAASGYAFYDAGRYGDVMKSKNLDQAVGGVVNRTVDYSLGGVAALLGSGALISGVVLIPVGQSNVNRAEKLGASGGIGLGPAPKGSIGAGLNWTF